MKLKTTNYKKCPCENCADGIYMTVEAMWWCDKHLKYACQMERNRLCEKFKTTSGDDAGSRKTTPTRKPAQESENVVSRKAIEKLKRWRFSYDTNTTIPKSDSFVKLTDLRDLPSVAPAPKKGKWIETTDVTLLNRQGYFVYEVICSECNGISFFRKMGNKYIGANLCPNCGAKMEAKKNE